MDWLDIITAAILALFHAFKSSTLTAFRLTLYCISLAAYPVAAIWSTFLFVFSPVIHTVRFLLSPLFWLLNSFPRLQPLYIFFGSAAFIGLIVGLIYKLTTLSIFSIFNLYDDPNESSPTSAAGHTKKSQTTPSPLSSSHRNPFFASSSGGSSKKPSSQLLSDDPYGFGYDDSSRPLTPNSQFQAEQRELEMLLANLSSTSRDSPNTKRKRIGGGPLGLGLGGRIGSSSGSRFHTILEEEDDSL